MEIIPARIQVWEGGSLLSVEREKTPNREQVGGGKRGTITGFSPASRRNLLRKIAMLQRDVKPFFVTLTYPKEYSKNPEVWKNQLKAWKARLERQYPESAFVWRLELQERGAPHYHLLVYGVHDTTPSFREWLATAWYEVVGSGDAKHLSAGTGASKIRSFRGVMAYTSKELAKVTQAVLSSDYPNGVGRWWGIYNRNNMPWATPSDLNLSEKEAVVLMRIMRRYSKIKARDYSSLKIFCHADFWFDKINKLLGRGDYADRSIPARPLAKLVNTEQKFLQPSMQSEIGVRPPDVATPAYGA